MSITILCLNCENSYLGLKNNIKVRGPIIETTCPHCKKFVLQNIGAFLEQQSKNIDGDIKKSVYMIKCSHYMEKHFVDERPYSKKKKQK